MNAAPWVILLAVFIYGVVHSVLASLRAKAKARGWFGILAGRGYRLAYNLLAILTILPVLALPVLLPDRRLYAIPSPWVYLTLAGQIFAVILLVQGVRQTGVLSFLGIRQLLADAHEERQQLVVGGLYRWVRHPLYSAGLLFIWLVPIMTANLLALNLALSAYLIIGALFEERKLRREYGEAYARYQERTPMLVPFLLLKK